MGRLVTAPWWVRLRRWWRGDDLRVALMERDIAEQALRAAESALRWREREAETLLAYRDAHAHLSAWSRRASVTLRQGMTAHSRAIPRDVVASAIESLRRGGVE